MRQLLLFALCSLVIFACGGSGDGLGGPHLVPEFDPNKGDNYISTNAREFVLTGTVHAKLPADFATRSADERDATMNRVVSKRMGDVSRSIRDHINAVLKDVNGGVTGEKANYFTYVRNSAGTSENIRILSDEELEFDFELELVGSPFLMSKLSPGEATYRTFEVTIKDWSASHVETVQVEIEGVSSTDAFPKYDALFKDGVLDLGIHFGGDYNEDRHDIDTAKWLVETLQDGGWTNPSVTGFDDLKIDSEPWIRTVKVNGRDLEIRVYIYHSDMVEEADEE